MVKEHGPPTIGIIKTTSGLPLIQSKVEEHGLPAVGYQKQHGEDDGEQNNTSPLLDQRTIHEENHDERKCSTSLSLLDKQCRVFSLAEIKMATHDFNDAFVIGKGGFGKVYKGKFALGEGIDVAIKRSDLNSTQGEAEFRAEIEMLSKFRHSHIVSLLGYCEEEMILVYEYMPNGSLEDHLHKRRANGSKSSALTWVQRLNICIGAARGLDYLHTGTGVQHRVIHRDVKSSNILLDENFAAKVSDFGVSRTGPAYQSGTTTNVYTGQLIGTFGYMDAEYFATHRLTRKSDVYAFGVVLLEVLCGRPALDFTLEEQQHSLAGWAKHCIKEGNIGQIIDPCLRGQVSAYYLKEFGQIAYKCLHTCSKDRPTMNKVLERLEFVLAWTLQTDQQTGLRTTFIGKTRSLFSTKATISSGFHIKNLGHSSGNKKKGIMMEKDAARVETASPEMVPPSGQTMMPPLKMFKFSELQRATRNFRLDRIIGHVGFGTVFIGWLDSVTYVPQKNGVGIPVAIKKSGDSFQGLEIEMWQTEVKFLGKLSHPNLVKLLGYCQEDNNFLLFYEYMPKGSLADQLFKKGEKPLPWKTRIKIAMGAAQGLAFLHTKENNVIFRDMKSSNILLDTNFNAKLSDCGLLRVGPVNGESHVSTRVMGTGGFAAPEYIATGQLSIKTDVYAFGVVMLEMITGLRVVDGNRHARKHNLVYWARPFLHKEMKLQRIMDPRLEQDYPLKGIRKTAELILTCLESEPKNRPSMEEVVSVLQVISAIEM